MYGGENTPPFYLGVAFYEIRRGELTHQMRKSIRAVRQMGAGFDAYTAPIWTLRVRTPPDLTHGRTKDLPRTQTARAPHPEPVLEPLEVLAPLRVVTPPSAVQP